MGTEVGVSVPKMRAVGHTGRPEVQSQTGLGAARVLPMMTTRSSPGHSCGRRGPSPTWVTWAGWAQGQTSSVGVW